MKLTKQIKADLATAYQCAMEVSILDMKAPLRYINQYIAENVSGYGTAADEKVRSREDYRKMLLKSRQQAKGMLFKAKIVTPYRPKFTDETTAQFHDEIVVQIGDKKKRHSIHLYMSCVFKYQFNKWQMVLFHGSMPDAASSTEDTFHVGEAEKKVKELEQVVAQRTADLQRKTRELEIEASLERVRAVTMGMNNPGDILNICKVFFNELQALGFKELRNTLINFWDDANGQLHDYDYSDFSGGNFAKLAYSSHPTFEEFQKKIRKAKDAFAQLVIDKKGLKSWQQRRHSSGEYKDPRLNRVAALYYYFYSTGVGALGISTFSPVSKEEVEVLKKFRNVFDMAYQRYVDIQKLAAQAREVQIELALERVRARTMAMQKSEELKDVIRMVLQQFIHLNIKAEHAGFYIDYKANDNMHIWLADPNIEPFYAVLPYFDSPTWKSFSVAKATGKNFYTDLLDFKTKNKFYRSLFKIFTVPEKAKKFYLECKGLAVSTVLLDNVGLYIENFSAIPYTHEENKILMRFGRVFQQTYTRFLDLQKAEAQARENQVQLALERVRARTMAMQRSDELPQTSYILFQQMKELGEPAEQLTIGVVNEEKKVIEISATVHGDVLKKIYLHSIEEPTMMSKIYKAWKTNQKTLVVELKGAELNLYNKYRNKLTKSEMFPTNLGANNRRIVYAAFFSKGMLALAANNPRLQSLELLKRFAGVFDLTYTRFLDLQKAEAQAREAQIEVSLERVRSRAMAMQSADELSTLIGTVFTELTKLDLALTRCIIWVFEPTTNAARWWMANSEEPSHPMNFYIRYHKHPAYLTFVKEWENQNVKFVYDLKGKDKINWDNILFNETELANLPDAVKNGMKAPKRVLLSASFNNFGGINVASLEPLSDEHFDILLRFAKVFDLTYTRFLDLQKAEERAREAKIEAALERVRSKAMAMHSSEDLSLTVDSFFSELEALHVTPRRCGLGIINRESRIVDIHVTTNTHENERKTMIANLTLKGHPVLNAIFENWEQQQEYHPVLYGSEIKSYYEAMNPEVVFPNFPSDEVQYGYYFFFKEGGVFAWTDKELGGRDLEIFRRYTSVLSLTYRRFMDLREAEAQAREAKIEAALEKVRSRTLAMQKSDELSGTAAVLFQQLIALGIAPNRLYIILIKENTPEMDAWVTDEDGSKVSMGFTGNYLKNSSLRKMYEGWEQQRKSLIIDMQGEELQQYFHYLHDELKVPFKGGLGQKRRIQHLAYFSHGLIGMASPDEQPAETLQLMERFAAVFNLTFTRFNDLKIAEAHALQAEQDLIAITEAKQKAEAALTELQATQKQLVQSEKMASLGELTAGIAHEIQNPLNFVNNFSEVSKELLDEMKDAIEKGDTEDAKEIMYDVIQNLEKINHHGKRADGIVKGMLQHSRTSSGQKELTDINALCDEYLRLAYHGLRAKDKSFNAKFETHFDEAAGKLSVIPQDIGRVVLNLINNAFYAVSERKKLNEPGYEPAVHVSTSKEAASIVIKVKDNGTGIPQRVLDKIFQPFFTTKPTGQGTGLGLSLSYDIVTKGHGGEVKVETRESEGTSFIIQLPYS